ncbi:hypothetical protein AC579_716 [Pseudocercospora musae]|uniref:Uncharacterized protein n=1 Tax=Pseudocercospora musae TaxID=113226 RepID=A0A139I495_9PEZI|nr:hypothetical protein AC579_716 [Pseudocercospora musae]
MYENLYNTMINKFFAENYDGADKMASSLRLKADLPLIYRVWCHVILGSAGAGANTNFLGHAQSAVDLINDSKEQGLRTPCPFLKQVGCIFIRS